MTILFAVELRQSTWWSAGFSHVSPSVRDTASDKKVSQAVSLRPQAVWAEQFATGTPVAQPWRGQSRYCIALFGLARRTARQIEKASLLT